MVVSLNSRLESNKEEVTALTIPDDGPVTCFLICQKSSSRKEESVSRKEEGVSRKDEGVPRKRRAIWSLKA